MKLILFCLINVIFSTELSDWIDSNRDVFSSGAYKISFSQEIETLIGNSFHFELDTAVNIIVFQNQLRYETSDKVIVANKEYLKLLNKTNKQLFISPPDQNFNLLLALDILSILDKGVFNKGEEDSYYSIKFDNFTNIKIYFKNKKVWVVEIFTKNINIQLTNIQLNHLAPLDTSGYFMIDQMAESIFDLRTND